MFWQFFIVVLIHLRVFYFIFIFFLIQKVVLTLSLSRILCAAAQGKNVTPLTGKRGAAPASSTTDVGSPRTCSAHAANASANARARLAWAMECGVELMILTNYDTTGREKAASAGLSGTAGVGETITALLLSSTASEFASKRRGSPYPFTIHGDVFLVFFFTNSQQIWVFMNIMISNYAGIYVPSHGVEQCRIILAWFCICIVSLRWL